MTGQRLVVRGRLLLLLAALAAFAPMSLDLYLPAFPSIADALGVPEGQMQVTFSACLIGLGAGQLIYGPLSDRYGRRRPLIVGLIVYTVASLACALAPSLWALVALRLLQGLGGCAGLVISRAIVRDLTEGTALARAYSTLSSVSLIAPLIAPTIGAGILLFAPWQGAFIVLACFGLLCLLGVSRLPETHAASDRVDTPLAGVGRLLCTPGFLIPAGIAALASASLFAYISSSPLIIIESYAVPPIGFALIFSLMTCAFILGPRANLWLLARWHPRDMLRVTVPAQIPCALAVLLLLNAHAPLWSVLSALALLMVCIGGTLPNAVAIAMSQATAGAASALLGAAQMGMGALVAGSLALLTWPPHLEIGVVMTGAAAVATLLMTVGAAHLRDPHGQIR